MKKNNPKMIAALAVVSLALLAGCTELPGKAKVNQDAEQNALSESGQKIEEAVKHGLGQAAAAVTQAAQNTADKVVSSVKEGSISRELQEKANIGSASALSVENAIGTLEVRSVQGDQIRVKATVQAYNTFKSEQQRREILDNAVVSVQVNGKQAKVITHAKDKPDQNLWTWAQHKFGAAEFSIDYVIEIPEQVTMYQLSNDVGDIKLNQLQGTYQVSTNVGAIHINGATVLGKSTIESDTGSITLNVADLQKGSSLKVSTHVGTITAAFAKKLHYNLETSSEIGHIQGAPAGKSTVGSGGPLVSLKSQIGAITVQQ